MTNHSQKYQFLYSKAFFAKPFCKIFIKSKTSISKSNCSQLGFYCIHQSWETVVDLHLDLDTGLDKFIWKIIHCLCCRFSPFTILMFFECRVRCYIIWYWCDWRSCWNRVCLKDSSFWFYHITVTSYPAMLEKGFEFSVFLLLDQLSLPKRPIFIYNCRQEHSCFSWEHYPSIKCSSLV